MCSLVVVVVVVDMWLLLYNNRVADHEASNRMSLRNLAMVFGPTLLRCSTRDQRAQTLEQLVTKGPHEVVVQSSVLHTILELRSAGVQF